MSDHSTHDDSIYAADDRPRWRKLPSSGEPPSPRGYHTATFHDQRLLVFGGMDSGTCFEEMHTLELGALGYLTATAPSARRRFATED